MENFLRRQFEPKPPYYVVQISMGPHARREENEPAKC